MQALTAPPHHGASVDAYQRAAFSSAYVGSTPEGGRIDLSVANDAHVVSIAVQDTGPGIPIEERARVFDPFYRVLGNEATGSGLGLSIVSTVVRRLGGEVELGEADDRASGLRVTVRLPAA